MNTQIEGTEGTRGIVEPIFRAKIWMQLIGVMMILSGVLTGLSIVGLLVAWVPIWAGVVLMQAAGAVSRAYEQGDHREAVHCMAKLKTYFTIFGVLMLIYIVIAVIGLFFGIGAGLAFL